MNAVPEGSDRLTRPGEDLTILPRFYSAIDPPLRGVSEPVALGDQPGEHDGNHAHELDQDVDAGAGGILEGIADGVAHHGGLVVLGALAAAFGFTVDYDKETRTVIIAP